VASIEIVCETHSTTEDNESGVATGWLPGRLSPTGREQARRMGDRRRHDGISAVFTSDLLRAVETVEIAFGHTATRWASITSFDGAMLEDLVDAPFEWQEGWEYRV
jgi:broad specificity phosphatase PhoE